MGKTKSLAILLGTLVTVIAIISSRIWSGKFKVLQDMSSEFKFVKRDEEDFGSGLLLHDIEEISHALYLHGNQLKALNPTSDHRTNVVSNYGLLEARNKFKIQDSPQKDKKHQYGIGGL